MIGGRDKSEDRGPKSERSPKTEGRIGHNIDRNALRLFSARTVYGASRHDRRPARIFSDVPVVATLKPAPPCRLMPVFVVNLYVLVTILNRRNTATSRRRPEQLVKHHAGFIGGHEDFKM
jgi:hypothetical protein